MDSREKNRTEPKRKKTEPKGRMSEFGSEKCNNLANNAITEKPNLLDFVVVSVPTFSGLAKYFVGQISEIVNEGLKINFLKKLYSKFECEKFCFPDKVDSSFVSLSEIVMKLNNPEKNRRGQLVFKDLKGFKIT